MTLFKLFSRRQGSSPLARERLQILLSHERSIRGGSDLISVLRGEILTVLGKHIVVDQDNVAVRMERGATLSTLEIEVLIPHSSAACSSLSDHIRSPMSHDHSAWNPHYLRMDKYAHFANRG
jgi:cell division topological specificity factor